MERFDQFPGPKGIAQHAATVGPHRYVVDVVRAAGRDDQDRCLVRPLPDGFFAVLSDGAGSSGHGLEAAEAVVQGLAEAASGPAERLGDRIVAVDDALAASHGGQATALAFFLGPDGLAGAGVGDTELWWRDAQGWHEGTSNVTRRPLVGTGAATVVNLHTPLPDVLVAATDGLWKYAAPFEVLARIDAHPTEPLRALDPLWLEDGGLPDDVTLLIARRQR
jgi:serine/threonine protein phosphatase PrpC